MAKTIRVIDLLNKIANGEEVPEEIKYKNSFYKWEQYHEKYWYYEIGLAFYRGLYFNDNILNDTVEIIEEQQDIDIQEIEMFEQEYFNEHEGNMSVVDVDLAVKINEILKWAKQLDKNIKDKE